MIWNYGSAQANSHENLRRQLSSIISKYTATVGIGVIHVEDGDTFTWNGKRPLPMLSVYKFPLALAVLNEVDKGHISLTQKMHINKSDLVDDTWSPMKGKYPNGNIDLTVAELLAYSVSQSDNIACDMLFRLMKGTKPVNKYIHQLGFKEMNIVATEHEMGEHWKLQYDNSSTPMAMTQLLVGFFQHKYLSDSSNRFLMRLMTESSNDATRIKGILPDGTVVAHKTGTSINEEQKLIRACNDAGIITMPDGTHLALTVFISNSSETYDTTRSIIARIAKTIFDFYKNTNHPALHRLQITHLTGDFYIFTTSKTFNDSHPVSIPANGMYVLTNNGVVMFDSPFDTTQFQPLLDSIRARHNKKVIMCLATHSHSDRTAGLAYYKQLGIKTYTTLQTDTISKKRGEKRAEFLLYHDTTFSVGQYSFQVYYPGEGHSPDNIVVWFDKQKILYGGCFVKSTEATDLGNLHDANVVAWKTSIHKVQHKFRKPEYIITGHNGWEDKKSLEYTLKLIKEYEKTAKQ